ncbi:MAG: chemotaxis protein CheW [Synechococcales bacterium]|nr:chemotaxis protein CheW [Synechococcales bacterium]
MLLKQRHSQQNAIAQHRLLFFPIGQLFFALRLDGVAKIIPLPPVFKSGDRTLGMTQWQDQEIIVIDLHQQIYQRPAVVTPQQKDFLIIVAIEAANHGLPSLEHQSSSRMFYGIPATQLPILKAIPDVDLHTIPNDYRDRDPLGIAEAMVQIQLDSMVQDRPKTPDRTNQTVPELKIAFLLDPTCLLELVKTTRQNSG